MKEKEKSHLHIAIDQCNQCHQPQCNLNAIRLYYSLVKDIVVISYPTDT